MKYSRYLNLLSLAAVSAILTALPVRAGTFFSDFNSGTLPAGTSVYGVTTNDTTGGYTNSGCIKLTKAVGSTSGGFVINDLDAGTPVVGFTASFKALIGGGTGADGMSFNFAPDVPLGTISEEGAGTGLTVEFDTFANAGDSIGIDVKVGGTEIGTLGLPASTLRANTFVDVWIQLAPDGTLRVYYDGTYAYTNLGTGITSTTAGLFGFGSRTGGSTDNHFIDNLSIVTYTNAVAFVDSYFPIGRNVRADAKLAINLIDNTTAVDTSTIVLKLDGTNVTPTIVQSSPNTTITFANPGLFGPGSSHTVNLLFADNATPTPNTNTLQYSFTVPAYATISTNLVANPGLVSSTQGFFFRVSQIDVNLGPTYQRAESQLANLLIDASTGFPYTNNATPNPADNSFNYPLTNTINMSVNNGQGNFPTDDQMPGLPGVTGGTINVAMDAVTYLYLTNGYLYTLGVNSSDGFRMTAASTPDFFATEESRFDGVRAAADTTTTFAVAKSGYYPFRILYYVGGPEVVNPTSDNPSLEFFTVDAAGTKTLINDVNTVGSVPAYLPAQTLPYLRSLSPAPGDVGVSRTSPIDATLVDGTITVQTNTIQLQLNGAVVSPIISSNSGITSIHYQPGTPFVLNSTNTVQLAWTDSASNRRTNNYQFVVENILTSLWSIAPGGGSNPTWAKWVTSAGTERGLAYNPKTKHVLLVSRNSAGGSDGPNALGNGAGIGVFDGDTGLYIKQLIQTNSGSANASILSGGTFIANMVDVADDGVIYVCNLATSGAQNFRIYRWQNEDAQPTIAYSAAPTAAAGTPRWGDDFCIRNSGAGTQIIASGNNTSANSVPVFTTTDGTNFSVTLTVPTSLPNASVRLGIAWGCGNTFYGETIGNGSDMRYVSLTGPPSTAGSLTASYRLVDKDKNQAIGPIGVDIANQRVIGDATSGSSGAIHSMNLYDLNTLALTTTTNLPIDSKPFAVSVGTFGTGSVDFTPDGTRVYTLDSGSGIIAFALNPKAAAPSVCTQPQNFIAPAGNIGFMGVTAIGSLQQYQWRLYGTNVPGATNRTLDMYYMSAGNVGKYTVVITNVLGSTTSSVAILDAPTVITNQPASQIVTPGASATFSVGASNALTTTFFYQWLFNGAPISGATTNPLVINNAQVANAGAYTVTVTDNPGQVVTSAAAVLTVGTAGTGDGLRGDYYNLTTFTGNPPNPFSGTPVFSRVDPIINLNFGTGSPDPSVNADYFSARWSGQVQPFYSQTYNFYATSDDGTRVWVNGTLVVTNWFSQAATERSGPSINLTANQKYDIVMEYYEQTSTASAVLRWSSPAQTKGVIPQSQLYSAASSPFHPTLTSRQTDATHLVLSWNGSYVLQTNGDLGAGTWATVTGATTPYTITVNPATPQLFFRLLSQ
jgi:hypothetical protein